ncbi:MAG: MBL fold metallo-hydrolase [Azospirillum sp.]|nr:MBL fold metallo-hydrolase [Azospirillum sp.]
MSNLSRRTLLGTAAAAAGSGAISAVGLTTTLPGTAAAAMPPASGRQVPGVYRYKIGAFEITALTDGVWLRKIDEGFVRNAKLDEVKSALAAAFLPTEAVPIPFTAVVINTGAKLIMIDTGFGNSGPPSAGQIAAGLAAAGIEPDAITNVVISHFHPDHISGVRAKDGALIYPNAEVMVPEPEWAFWMDDNRAAGAPEGLKGNFANARRVFGPNAKDVTRFKWGQEVVTGITAIEAPGHTPGHTAFALSSENDHLLVLSDVTNVPFLFVRNPDWQVMFDMDGDQAQSTRHRLLDMAATDRMQVGGYHFPFPATGHIAKDGSGYQLVPAMWQANL